MRRMPRTSPTSGNDDGIVDQYDPARRISVRTVAVVPVKRWVWVRLIADRIVLAARDARRRRARSATFSR